MKRLPPAKPLIKQLARYSGLKVVFKKNMPGHAKVNLLTEIIYVNDDNSKTEDMLSFFFHEFTHLWCKHNKKYPLFHGDESKLTKKQQSYFLATVWRAEAYVDQKAKEIMAQHFPGLKYNLGYTKRFKKDLHPIMVAEYREYFDYLNARKKKSKKP